MEKKKAKHIIIDLEKWEKKDIKSFSLSYRGITILEFDVDDLIKASTIRALQEDVT